MTVSLLLLLLAAEGVVEGAPAPERLRVPAMTPVFVKVDEEISSKVHKSGYRFPIRIAEDVRVGEIVVIPAGAAGEGEVVHAARSSIGGKPGELILAARYVRVGEIEIPLRSMVLGGAGKNRMNESLAASFVYGVGLFVVGGAVIVPRDTLASAKTAVEIELPAQAAAPAGPTPAPVDATTDEEKKGGDTDETKTT
jgi:hypothetical protein